MAMGKSESEKQLEEAAMEQNPFSAALERGENAALLKVMERFDFNENAIDRLPFHNSRHTKDVVRRTDAILAAIQEARPDLVDSKQRSLGRFAGAYHDTVQNYEEDRLQDSEQEKVRRKRFTVKNEAASADEATDFMRKINDEAGAEIFTKMDMDVVRHAIDTTVPGFDPEKGTVIQPNLKEQSSIIERAVALADLGAAGMDGPDKYIVEGRNVFREENLDILRAFEGLEKDTDPEKELPPDKVEYFKKRMLGWSASQVRFAEGRKAKLEDELNGLPEDAKNAVRELFNKFDETIDASKKKHEEERQMPFNDLARSFGYSF